MNDLSGKKHSHTTTATTKSHHKKWNIHTHVFNNKSPNKMFALQNQSSRFKWRLIILFDIFEVKWTHRKKTNVILYKKWERL